MFPGNCGWYPDIIGNAGSCICFLQTSSQTICPVIPEDVNLILSPRVAESRSLHSFLHEFFNCILLSYWGMKKGKKKPKKKGKKTPKKEEGIQEYFSFASTTGKKKGRKKINAFNTFCSRVWASVHLWCHLAKLPGFGPVESSARRRPILGWSMMVVPATSALSRRKAVLDTLRGTTNAVWVGY